MHFDTDGIYTLQYTATDSCGNETIEERTVEVVSLRTVLYADGTFIINEKSTDIDANVALHGVATNVYDPMLADGSNYVFSGSTPAPWSGKGGSVVSVEIGSPIAPTSTARWFPGFKCTSMDLKNIDTSNVTNMQYMFAECDAIKTIDLSGFDTSKVTDMKGMFNLCKEIEAIDLHNFNTSKVTDMEDMFAGCYKVESIDVSNFDTANVTKMNRMFASTYLLTELDVSSFDTHNVTDFIQMFNYCEILETIYASQTFTTQHLSETQSMFGRNTGTLKGGADTRWSSSHIMSDYAHIDGGTANPGYFTAKA